MGILQGIIFGLIVLLNKKYSSRTNNYIAFTALCLSFSNLQYWFFDTKLYKIFPFLDWFRVPCEFLMIPMFYLFVSYYLDIKVSKKTKTILVLPFIIDFICQIVISINILCFENKFLTYKTTYIYYIIEELSSFSFSSYLMILIIQIIKKYEFKNNTFKIEIVKAKTKWIKQILLIGLICCFFWIIEIYLMKDNAHQGTSIYYPLWICISIIIYWLSYVGLSQSTLLSERKDIRKELSVINKVEIINSKSKKDLNSKSKDKILSEFKNLIENLYMDPNLNLDKIANKLGISNNYLSQIINSNNIKFNDYLNFIRVEKVKTLLNDEKFSHYTITSIGLEAGFNSNASFYRAFKKHTSITPLEYRSLE